MTPGCLTKMVTCKYWKVGINSGYIGKSPLYDGSPRGCSAGPCVRPWQGRPLPSDWNTLARSWVVQSYPAQPNKQCSFASLRVVMTPDCHRVSQQRRKSGVDGGQDRPYGRAVLGKRCGDWPASGRAPAPSSSVGARPQPESLGSWAGESGGYLSPSPVLELLCPTIAPTQSQEVKVGWEHMWAWGR